MKAKRTIAAWIAGLAALCATFLLIGCPGSHSKQPPIRIAYMNWDEGLAITHVVLCILEDEFDREIELDMSTPSIIFPSLANGTLDLMLDAWLPQTHAVFFSNYEDTLEQLGTTYAGARTGLVVPAYMGIESIDELAANADKFGGTIVGIQSDSGIMRKTEKAIKVYSLGNITLTVTSCERMTDQIKSAVAEHRPIVATGWTPHWAVQAYHLKFLKDPKGVYDHGENIRSVARPGFSADNPKIAAFLGRMTMDDETMGNLLGALKGLQTFNDRNAAARNWIAENNALVSKWLGREPTKARN